jgi:hypothetical protein
VSARRALALLTLAVVAAAPLLSAQDRGRYRDFQLGASVAAVTGQIGASPADLKTVHQRPALLQDLKWRPSFSVSSVAATRADPVEQVVFSFVDNQLYRLVVDYDRRRVDGLTPTDMVESISETYGAAVLVPGAGLAAFSADGQPDGTIIARWTDADNTVDLLRPAYGTGFRLMVTSRRLDTVARKAMTEARRLDEREAPQRELALARKDADDQLAAQEKARAANKSTFKP